MLFWIQFLNNIDLITIWLQVWDIHAKPNLEHTIYTIASVGHVKWRPQKKYDISIQVKNKSLHVPNGLFAWISSAYLSIAFLGYLESL